MQFVKFDGRSSFISAAILNFTRLLIFFFQNKSIEHSKVKPECKASPDVRYDRKKIIFRLWKNNIQYKILLSKNHV